MTHKEILDLKITAVAKFIVKTVASKSYCLFLLKVKEERSYITVNGTPSHSYGMSLAIWDHTVLPSTRHK